MNVANLYLSLSVKHTNRLKRIIGVRRVMTLFVGRGLNIMIRVGGNVLNFVVGMIVGCLGTIAALWVFMVLMEALASGGDDAGL